MSRKRIDDEADIGRLIRASGRGPVPPPGARERVYARVRAEWERSVAEARPQRRRVLSWRGALGPALAVAAIVLVAIGVVSILRGPGDVEATTVAVVDKIVGPVELAGADGGPISAESAGRQALVAGDRLKVGGDGGAAMTLAGGESLRLKSDSEMHFVAADRVELLSGVVYIDSENGPASGVAVATRFGEVRHVGTQYEIGIGSADLTVRVREGRVAISAGGGELVGRAGEQILVRPSGDVRRSDIAPTDAAWLWTEALAVLPDAPEHPLPDVLAWVARQTGRSLEFGSDDSERRAAGLVLHGLGGLTPAETIDVVRSTTDLDYRLTDRELVVD